MTSLRQLEANRDNAQRSTGPRTDESKRVSRRNALRHGLAAETVIEIVEDLDDYKAFEANIIADYDARSAVERELVLRLASLLWRMRRATGIETDLLRMQAEILRERAQGVAEEGEPDVPSPNPLYRALHSVVPARRARKGNDSADETRNDANGDTAIGCLHDDTVDPTRTLTYCFLRVANLHKGAFKRLNRYEAALWRQTVQTMIALGKVRCRYP
jgi:hypothetical protein